MSALYVCLFSNGHLKVGRSAYALARIAQHEERVSCLGALKVLRCTMSQAAIAQAIGVNHSRISRWEAGHVSSGANAAAKLIALAKEKTADASPGLASKEAA